MNGEPGEGCITSLPEYLSRTTTFTSDGNRTPAPERAMPNSSVAAQRGETVFMNAASSVLFPPHMYSMPCATWMGGFVIACAEVKAPKMTTAAMGRQNRFGFICCAVLLLEMA